MDLIHDIPTVAELVRRLRREYVAAYDAESFREAAELADLALSASAGWGAARFEAVRINGPLTTVLRGSGASPA